eukprot:jgi/Bigna1/130569/aug1.11_g5277
MLLIFAVVTAVVAAAAGRWYYLDQRITKTGIPTTWISPLDIIRGNFEDILIKITSFLDENNGLAALRSPAGKPFIIANSPELLCKILTGVPQRKLHANGVQNPLVGAFSPKLLKLERKVSSSIDDTSLNLFQILNDLFDEFGQREFSQKDKDETDTSEALRDFWWKVRLTLIFGKVSWSEHTIMCCKTRFYAEVDQFASLLINMFPFAKYLPLPSTVYYRFTVWRLRNHLRSLINEFEAKKRVDCDNEWALLHEAKRESIELKIDLCMKMLFVGIGPLTDIVCWMLFHIAQDKEMQSAMAREIKAASTVNFKQITKLPILDAVYKETLRMYAPVHVGRMTMVPQQLLRYNIPKDSDFMTNMHFVHRSKHYYENPNSFDYRRFLSKNGLAAKEFSSSNSSNKFMEQKKPFIPFGIGSRSCPGSMISGCIAKTFVTNLLSKYSLEFKDGAGKVATGYNLVMPIRPMNLKLKMRKRKD